MKNYLLEFIGTFCLVLVGTGAVVIDQQTGGQVTLFGIAVAFGGVIALMITLFGHQSGSHINPAVTIALAVGKGFRWSQVLPYIIAQFLGAITGSVAIRLLLGNNTNLGMTLPRDSITESFVVEAAMTFVLMMIILIISHYDNGKRKIKTAIGVGIGIIPLILYSGPISGGSFNPARSFGPAIIAGNLFALWIYFVATILGAVLAMIIWHKLKRYV